MIFIDWFDPAYKAGGPVVSVLNLVRTLNEHFDFHVFTGNREYGDGLELPVEKDRWLPHVSGVSVYYSGKLDIWKIRRIIRDVRPDLIYINGLFSFYFSILPLILSRNFKIPVIVAPRGMLSPGSYSIKTFKKKPFLIFMKSFGFYKYVFFQATGESEAGDIDKLIGNKSPITIAPNITISASVNPAKRIKNDGELKLIFIGRLAPEKNLHFAINLMRNTGPGVSLDIYGPLYNETYYEKCLKNIEDFKLGNRIRFRGELEPITLQKSLFNYHVLLLPTTGENFGHAIIESLSSGLPVIISDQTPWKNLKENGSGFSLSLSDDKPWLDSLTFFTDMNQDIYDHWSTSALKYALNYKSSASAEEQNIKMFRLALGIV